LLTRSLALESQLEPLLTLDATSPAPRLRASRQMFSISFEHGCSIRLLIEAGNPTSAFGLARLQYEALVRGVWLSCSANEAAVTRLCGELSDASMERLPMVSEMLKNLTGSAPPGVLATLEDFREKSLKPLNSFVHSGSHALQRSHLGYPEALVRQVLIASNALQWLNAFEAAALADDANAAVRLYGLRTEYDDCLPGVAV